MPNQNQTNTESSFPERRKALWRKRVEREDRWTLRVGHKYDFRSRHIMLIMKLATLTLKMLGLFERGKRNACSPSVTERRFRYPNLPAALQGFRILHLTDTHFDDEWPEFTESVHDLLAGLEVDLCVLTGDYRYGHCGSQEHVPEQVWHVLEDVQSRHGFYAILGNHDLSDIVPGLRERGVNILLNEGTAIREGDTTLWLGGVDDPHKFQSGDPELALAEAPEDTAFKLFLAHTPECIPEAEALGADLYLCGHTHGGQICFPFIGPIHKNARCAYQYAYGEWRYGKTRGYTANGLGVTDMPVRFRCPPEAVIVTLEDTDATIA